LNGLLRTISRAGTQARTTIIQFAWLWLRRYQPDSCVYRKLKFDYNGDEVRQGWGVNE
jgi:hypothetical protein